MPPMDALPSAWKFGINPQYREWFIRRIISNLKKRHGSTLLGEIKNQSIQYEEQIFGTAKDQNEYFQRVSTVLFALEKRNLKALGEISASREASVGIRPQVRSQGKLVLNHTDQSRTRQNVLPCNRPNNFASFPVQGSTIHYPVFCQSSNFQNLPGESQHPMDSSEEYFQTPYGYSNAEQWHNLVLQEQMLKQQQQQQQYLYQLQQQKNLCQPQTLHFNQQQLNQTVHPYYTADNLDPNRNQINRELPSALLQQSVLQQPENLTSPILQSSQPSIQLMKQVNMQAASLTSYNQAILPSNLQSSQLLGQQNSYRQKQTIFGQMNSRLSMPQTGQEVNHQNVSFQHNQLGTEGNGSMLHQHHNKPLPHGFQLQQQREPNLLKRKMHGTLKESLSLTQSQNATDQQKHLLQSERGLQSVTPKSTNESGHTFVPGDLATEEGTRCIVHSQEGFYKKLADHNIRKEIAEIVQHLKLITVGVEYVNPNQVTAAVEPKGTVINCSTKFPPKFRSFCESKGWSPIWSLRLMIPPNYPNSSPAFSITQLPVTLRMEPGDLCLKARSDYCMLIRDCQKPISVKQMIRFWELYCQKMVKDIMGVIDNAKQIVSQSNIPSKAVSSVE